LPESKRGNEWRKPAAQFRSYHPKAAEDEDGGEDDDEDEDDGEEEDWDMTRRFQGRVARIFASSI
jgi:hypothetical protein